jgi:hypothetical protein
MAPSPFAPLSPLSPPHVRGEVVVLKGGVEKLRVPMDAEMLTKAMLVGPTKGEMPPEMRAMPMEPMVQSMAAAGGGRECATGEGWRRSQYYHQERDEQPPAMSRHDSSPLPMCVSCMATRCPGGLDPAASITAQLSSYAHSMLYVSVSHFPRAHDGP